MNAELFATRHVTTTPAADQPVSGQGERALVLGGAGAAGNAWVIGVVAGLRDAGLDVTHADLIIGTSAGSTAAAQITSASPTELLAAILEAVPPQLPGPVGAGGGRGSSGPPVDHLERTDRIIGAAEGPVDMRRQLGASALELPQASNGSWQARWRETVAARLPSQTWPEQRVLITAVDAETGEPVVFDRFSGVDLADAIAASCSSGPPYRIGGSRFIDGGYRRSSENADLAAGYERVLVLSPFGGRTRAPLDWGMQLAVQIDELRAAGSRVESIFPSGAALAAFGDNVMDLSRRPPAARAGFEQGRDLAHQLAEFWH